MRIATLLTLAVALPAAAMAEDWRHARVRHVEPGVSVQRAAEAASEEAAPNLPFLPGDRAWTDDRGRVEFQFSDGSLLRLDSGSKLDYATHEGDRGAGRAVLRLWSGSAYVHARGNRGTEFEVETPGGVVTLTERGIVRVDTRSGDVRVSVYDGRATFEGEREERIAEGERLEARRGVVEAGPEPFDRSDRDEFAAWVEERDQQSYARRENVQLYDELLPYAGELDAYGSWVTVDDVGYAWRPHVAVGWQPYLNGRWAWTPYGWTWVSYDPWGWAPFHYGRWGHSLAYGWYWIPGRDWGPAWVSWATGPRHVGWCALGWRDRPVVIHGGHRLPRGRGGHAVPRGTHVAGDDAWVYTARGDLAAHDLLRKRLPASAVPVADVRVAPTPTARPDRDLRIVEGPVTRRTTPRNVRTKPTPGDTVPELRADPMTTIPFPVARKRKPKEGEERRDRQSFGEAAGPRPAEPQAVTPIQRTRPAEPAPRSVGVPSGARTRRPLAQPEPDQGTRTVAPPLVSRPRRVMEPPVAQPAPAPAGDREATPRLYRPAPREARPVAPAGEVAPRVRSQPREEGDRVQPRDGGYRTPPSGRSRDEGSRAQPAGRSRPAAPPAAAPAPAPAPKAAAPAREAPARDRGHARSRDRN